MLSISPQPTNGNVTSNPTGIHCGSRFSMCSADFINGTSVTLTAIPNTGYAFAGWGGDCVGCGTNATCTITMTANRTCTANFRVARTFSISSPPPNGTITSSPAGINCGTGGSACSATFADGTTITLTATPDAGRVFVGWGGDCAGCGSSPTCTITISGNLTCTADFGYRFSISTPPTNGTITSSPAGINCGSSGSDCSANFAEGESVTLTATPDPGYVFVGWGGDCASSCGSSPTCTITMNTNTTCTANFRVARTLSISPTPANGTIRSNPMGISCGSGGSACSADFADGTPVTLTAIPDSGYVFVRWGGACAFCGNKPTCTIIMDANTTCTAIFGHSLSISPRPTNGNITGPGINCGSGGSTCCADFADGRPVTLSPHQILAMSL